MNLRQIEFFRAVVACGSITGAADALHVTAPGVSRMIKHLELRLGVRLFERAHGRLTPTPDAQRLYAEIQRVYAGVERIREVAYGLKDGEGARLNVVCSPSAGMAVVPAALARFARRYPQVDIDYAVQPVAPLLNAIASGHHDLGISIVPIEHPGIEQRELAQVPTLVALQKGAALTRRRILKWSDLNDQPFIAFAADSVQGTAVNKALEHAAVTPHRVMTTRSASDALRLVDRGVGIAVVDALSGHAYGSDGVVLRRLADPISYALTLVWASASPLSEHQRQFVEMVRQELVAIKEPDMTCNATEY